MERQSKSSEAFGEARRTVVLGDFVLDLDGPELLRDGQPVVIRATPLRVLIALAGRAGRVVSKQELMEEVWPGVAVSDASLATAIRELRQALGDDGSRQRVIETLRNRGYRLMLPAAEPAAPRADGEAGDAAAGPASLDLLANVGRQLFQRGRQEEARAIHRETAQAARREGDDARFVEAALDFAGDLALAETGADHAECIALLEEALGRDAAAAPGQRARLRSRLALNIAWARREEAVALVHDACRLARAAGDPGALALILYDAYLVLWSPDDLRELEALAAEMLEAAARAGDALTEGFAHYLQSVAHLEAGERARAEASSMAAFEKLSAGDHGALPHWRASWNACMALLDGRFAEAERLAGDALRQGLELRSRNAQMMYAVQMASLRIDQGREAELEPFLDRLEGERPSLQLGAALLRHACGDVDAARSAFAARMEHLDEIPRDSDWLSTMTLLVELAARLEDAAAAARLHDLLAPHESQCVLMGVRTVCRGSVALYAGLAARTAGRMDAVVPHLELAVRINVRLRALPLLTRAQLALAEALLERADEGDRERARDLLAECGELCRGIGLEQRGERVGWLLERR